MDFQIYRKSTIRPAWISAAAVLTIVIGLAGAHDVGPHAHHMILHILLMSGLAPLTAILWLRWQKRPSVASAFLWSVGLLQVVALWAWHAPSVHQWLAEAPALSLVGHAVLFGIATLFWACVIGATGPARWQTIPALMLTGKLVCLLAALLIFAPRLLYHAGHDEHGHALADQQLAGLLMITACPISYLLAALLIAVELIGGPAGPPTASRPASAEP